MVVGDPAGMRALADRFDKDAEQLRRAKREIGNAWRTVDGTGPWHRRAGSTISGGTAAFAAAAQRLEGLAGELRTSARNVEAAIEAERRRLERERLEAERRAREAAARRESSR